MPLRLMQITIVPKTLANFQSCIQAHGDVIFVPDNSANGRAIIERDVEKWFAALCMHGYMDFALWQIEELKISLSSEVLKREVMEGEKADEARKKISRIAGKAQRAKEGKLENSTTKTDTEPTA